MRSLKKNEGESKASDNHTLFIIWLLHPHRAQLSNFGQKHPKAKPQNAKPQRSQKPPRPDETPLGPVETLRPTALHVK